LELVGLAVNWLVVVSVVVPVDKPVFPDVLEGAPIASGVPTSAVTGMSPQ